MKISVIGAGGFVGQEVVRQLTLMPQVEQIRCVDLANMPFTNDSRVQVIQGNFSEPEVMSKAVDGVDKVIFLAAILGGAAESNPALARRVNVDATLDLMEYLRSSAPDTRFVLASTIAVYAKPMPEIVDDSTPFAPSMLYGAHKLMMEVALSNFSCRGWLDGVSVRPSGVMARDGADAALKSAFMSRLFWCFKRGEDITLPVEESSRTWLTSVQNVAANFIHASMLPAIGTNKAFTLPALSVTFGELIAGLRRAFPESATIVTYSPDESLVALFGRYPELRTQTADELGFSRDSDVDALIASSMREE